MSGLTDTHNVVFKLKSLDLKYIIYHMINIAIVDDEPEFASLLEHSLVEYFQEERLKKEVPFHIDVYPSAILFLEKCSGYNIIFMDIDLPIINGLTASKELREKNENAILIYCTNYARFAIDGYQYNASDYLVKPVNKQHLKMTMDKAVESIESMKKSSITISVDKSKKIVKLDDIEFVEVKGKLLYFHLTKNRVFVERRALKEVSQELDGARFVRCNHCYLVNVDYVKEFDEDNVVLTSGAILAMSRNKKKEFQEKVTVYLGSRFLV